MAGPGRERVATTGRLPFSLTAEALRTTTGAILAELQAELDRLATATEPPTVENFLRPLDRLLLRVYDASSHGSLLFQVHPDEGTRAAGRDASEAADRFLNQFRLRSDVYRRLQAVDAAALDPTARYAVEKLAREMRRAGVERPAEEREAIVALVNRIDRTMNEFSQNIAEGDRSIEVDGPGALRGLPADYLAADPPDAGGRIKITTRYPDAFPVMSYCEDADTRRRLLHEVLNIAYPKNVEVLRRLLAERSDLAHRLGYASYASYATEDKMIERPEAAAAFLDRLARLLRGPAERDLDRFLARKRRDQPHARALEPWDAGLWGDGLYDTYLRQEEYGVDPRALRAYLPYGAVRDGLFRLCEELFGLTIRPIPGAETWHSSVEAYDMTRGGRPVGRFFLDLIPRKGKFNHAAEFSVRNGLATGDLPQAALICNFLDPNTPPAEARMEYRDVVTFFHEFGHLLHALFSGHGPWLFTSTAHIEWDFVEAPSQLFEEWAHDPATLARFARDPDTREPIPADLVSRVAAAEAVGRAARQLRQVALARISLELYRRSPDGIDTTEVFREVWDATYPLPWATGYHAEVDWGHLTGYSACYYTYLWSAVIARDLLSPFHGKGSLTDLATAERYATEILAPGSVRPAAELIRRFLGRDFAFAAYERWALEGSVPPPAPSGGAAAGAATAASGPRP